MASIPVGSLVAKNDYYRKRLGSASSVSSCGSTGSNEHLEGPHHPHPALPSHSPGNWWLGFFFNKNPPLTPPTSSSTPPGHQGTPLESSELAPTFQQPPILPGLTEYWGAAPPEEAVGAAGAAGAAEAMAETGGAAPPGLLAGFTARITAHVVPRRGSAATDPLHGAADLELTSATAMMAALAPAGNLTQSEGTHPGP